MIFCGLLIVLLLIPGPLLAFGKVVLPSRPPIAATGIILDQDQVRRELQEIIPGLGVEDIGFSDYRYSPVAEAHVHTYAQWYARYVLTRLRPHENGSYYRKEAIDCEKFANLWVSLLAFSLDPAFPAAGPLVGIIRFYPGKDAEYHAGIVWRGESGYYYLEPQARLHPEWRSLKELTIADGMVRVSF